MHLRFKPQKFLSALGKPLFFLIVFITSSAELLGIRTIYLFCIFKNRISKLGRCIVKQNLSPRNLLKSFAQPFLYVGNICLSIVKKLLTNLARITEATGNKKRFFPNFQLEKIDFSNLQKGLIQDRGLRSYIKASSLKKFSKIPLKPDLSIFSINFKFPKFRVRKGILALLFFLTAFISFISWFYLEILIDLPGPDDLANHRPYLTTKIFDRKGKLLYKIYRQENRTLVSLDELPEYVIDSAIAAEDREFWTHKGVSFRGIIRAFLFNINNPDQEPMGGSTITQQLVKNVFFDSEKTYTRKIKEALVSLWIEKRFSKEEILQMYFNQIPYGGTAYGIEEAAQKFFGISAKDLSLAQAAMLAGLPKSPTKYSPFGAYPELSKKRQDQVLSLMKELGMISEEEYKLTLSEPVKFKRDGEEILAPHFVFYVKDLLVQKYGQRMVEQGGLNVYTTLDLDIQNNAQKILSEEVDKVLNFNINNGAALITLPSTGEILAMVGSKDYYDYDNDGNVNVILSPRQPGSTIKPINYALALMRGYTPATIIQDTPVTYRYYGSPSYSPVNYDNRFHGPVTLRTALGSSLNVPAVKVLATNGVSSMIDLGERMGISTWEDRSRFGLSLTLGGGEVKMIDMASAYGVFANLGAKVYPNPFIKIINSKGETIYSRSEWENDQVLNPGVSYIINDILADDQARQIAFGRNSMLHIPGKVVSVKTGTTNLMKDNWAIGYTSQFLVAAWVGNNDSSPMSRVASGITGATPIWRRLTDYMLELYPETGWEIPNDLIVLKICNTKNGGVCQGCSSGRTEYFLKSNSQIASCSNFKPNEALGDEFLGNKPARLENETALSSGSILSGSDEEQIWRITNTQ